MQTHINCEQNIQFLQRANIPGRIRFSKTEINASFIKQCNIEHIDQNIKIHIKFLQILSECPRSKQIQIVKIKNNDNF
jgi:hypothetical protein